MDKQYKLWYTHPANDWNEALPLGNGRLGVMAYGRPERELLQINEETLWSGLHIDRNNPFTLENLPKIRELVLEGKIQEAQRLMVRTMTGMPCNERVYQTAGQVFIDMEHAGDISGYRRELDLQKAVYTVVYQVNGIQYTREVCIPKQEDVIAVRITADQPGAVTLRAGIERFEFCDRLWSEGDDTIALNGGTGLRFCTMLRGFSKGGRVSNPGGTLCIDGADEAVLYLDIQTNFRQADPEAACRCSLARRLGTEFTEICQNHTAEYRQYFDRVDLWLAGDPAAEQLPTDQRLQNLAQGGSDHGLMTLYYDFGRYLMISGSRPGGLPLNLQGIWNQDITPAWGSKYTININTEMNYWPAGAANLPEMEMPLFDLLERMYPNGRHTADFMYGCRGFVAHHNTDIWGDTAPQDEYIPATYWVLGAAWLCLHIWEHYQFTRDLDFLRRYYYLMRESARFFEDFLIEDSRGRMIICPSVSPENSYIHPSGERGAICAGCTMDSQILRELFQAVLQAAELLGEQDTDILWQLCAKLPETEIASNGTVREWPEEYEEVEIGHRHISHLFGLYPAAQITPRQTPELALAARKTLERRLSHGGGHTGWSRAWIINFWARLLDAETAYENLRLLLQKSTLPNLFDNHPPFQIDGNFGGAAGIMEMLLQSQNGELLILPALPAAWRDGHAYGLKARGNITVDMEWKDGKLTKLTLTPGSNVDIRLIYGEVVKELALVAGVVTHAKI